MTAWCISEEFKHKLILPHPFQDFEYILSFPINYIIGIVIAIVKAIVNAWTPTVWTKIQFNPQNLVIQTPGASLGWAKITCKFCAYWINCDFSTALYPQVVWFLSMICRTILKISVILWQTWFANKPRADV